jgi:hypothetical protein
MPIEKIVRDGKKFMWDGKLYPTEQEAGGVAASYAKDGFETAVAKCESSFKVYTRRKATPPPTTPQP